MVRYNTIGDERRLNGVVPAADCNCDQTRPARLSGVSRGPGAAGPSPRHPPVLERYAPEFEAMLGDGQMEIWIPVAPR